MLTQNSKWIKKSKGALTKAYRSWRHFGTVMLLSKAWEKYVVDPHRFRGDCKRTIPHFPVEISHGETPIPHPPATPKKLTVCYFLHYFYPDKQGGTERFILNLAKGQQRMGNCVHVVTLGKQERGRYSCREGEILWEEFTFENIPVTQIRYRRAPRGLYYDCIDPEEPHMTAFAEKILSRYAPDVVHLAYPQPFAALARVCMKRSVPYLVTLTDFNIFCHYATMVRKDGLFCAGSGQGERCRENCKTYGVKDFHRRYQNASLLLQGAFDITVPSRFVAAVVGQEFPEVQIHVVPHGLGGDFVPNRKRTQTRTFLYAGTLSELKGVRLLIQAFRNIPGDIALLICGGGDFSYVELLKRAAGEDERIRFCGEVSADRMPEMYRQADCVVVPSIWYETYNFVLREALSCGCIGVASHLGAMPEAIAEGENGFTFEAGDVRALGAALRRAAAFDWSGYRQKTFPQIEDEAFQYQYLYQKGVGQQ